MIRRISANRRFWTGSAVVLAGMAFQFGWVGTCNDRFMNATEYVDPCGTILGNCEPGDFQVYNADIGDYCVDPACTVPGSCGNEDQPLGTTRNLCP